MIKLVKSPVVFNEENHTYFLETNNSGELPV